MMLCAGVVHGDLSDFNVLLGPDGPVIIDFPQAVDAAHNNNARKLLVRDVTNLQSFLARYAPNLKFKKFGEEMWALYENNELRPDTKLTGRFKRSERVANTSSLLDEIQHFEAEEAKRREVLGLPPPRRRAPVVRSGPAPVPISEKDKRQKNSGPAPQARGADPSRKKKKRRRRRRRHGEGDVPRQTPAPSKRPINPLDALLLIED
jgi:RIO kinase 1